MITSRTFDITFLAHPVYYKPADVSVIYIADIKMIKKWPMTGLLSDGTY